MIHCQDCRYWEPDKKPWHGKPPAEGTCHRHPPQLYGWPPVPWRPLTPASEGCGDGAPRLPTVGKKKPLY